MHQRFQRRVSKGFISFCKTPWKSFGESKKCEATLMIYWNHWNYRNQWKTYIAEITGRIKYERVLFHFVECRKTSWKSFEGSKKMSSNIFRSFPLSKKVFFEAGFFSSQRDLANSYFHFRDKFHQISFNPNQICELKFCAYVSALDFMAWFKSIWRLVLLLIDMMTRHRKNILKDRKHF